MTTAATMLDIGRIVTVRVDGDITIEVGHYMVSNVRSVRRGKSETEQATTQQRIYEVIRVRRQQPGKTPGRYELRARIASEVPIGALVHPIEWAQGAARAA